MQLNIKKIDEFRKKKGWPRYKMAAECGMPISTYHYIMALKSQPRLVNIEKIAKVMKIKPASLVK